MNSVLSVAFEAREVEKLYLAVAAVLWHFECHGKLLWSPIQMTMALIKIDTGPKHSTHEQRVINGFGGPQSRKALPRRFGCQSKLLGGPIQITMALIKLDTGPHSRVQPFTSALSMAFEAREVEKLYLAVVVPTFSLLWMP